MKFFWSKRDMVGWAIIAIFFLAVSGYLVWDAVKVIQARSTGRSAAQQAPSSADSSPESQQMVSEIHGSDPAVLDLIQKVSRHMLLPDGSLVTAEVSDPEASRRENPVFYQHAQKGDQVLIYPDRAILYNPSSDRIVDILHNVQ